MTGRQVSARGGGQQSDNFALFEHVWPVVAARLERSLSTRGVDRVTREDIVQEVACRVLDKRVPFTSADDLTGWALTTGHNLWTDDGRRWARRGAAVAAGVVDRDGALAALPAPGPDVVTVVEDRLAVEAVLGALRAMSAADRDAIVAFVTGHRVEGRRETSRVKVRRHRARERLRPALDRATAVLEGVAAFGVVARRWLRDLTLRTGNSRLVEPLVSASGAVLSPVLAGLVVLAAAGHHAPERLTAPSVVAAATAPATTGAVAAVDRRGEATAANTPARRPDPTPEHRGPSSTPLVESRVPAPTGGPLVDGRVAEEPGDDASLCLGNIPVLGTRCITGDPLPRP